MVLNTLIDKITGKQRERQKAKEADYRKIVRLIADGKEPDADRVEGILRDVGKSLGDLQAAVELLQTRRELKAKIDALPKLRAERNRIKNKIAALNADLEEADKRHSDAVLPLEHDLINLRISIGEGESASAKLWETCDNPELISQLHEVLEQLRKAEEEAMVLRDTAEAWRNTAKRDLAAAEQAKRIINGERRVEEILEQVKGHERKAADAAAELAKVEKTISQLSRQEEGIRNLMLVP